MRKWKRVETANGPRFRSALASHEAALLKNLVSAMIGLLDERESSAPADELEEITGIKTGNAEPPRDPTLRQSRTMRPHRRRKITDPRLDRGLVRAVLPPEPHTPSLL